MEATEIIFKSIAIRDLLEPPALMLTEDEHLRLHKFAQGLFNGQAGELKAEADKSLGQLYNLQTKTHIQFFCLEYFNDPSAESDAKALGLRAGEPVDAWIAQLRDITAIAKRVESGECKAITQRSNRWRRQQLADLLAQDPALDDQFEPFTCIYVNYQPAVFLNRIEGLLAYKKFYDELANRLTVGSDDISRAKQALISVHQRRAEGLLRDDLALIESLNQQLQRKSLTDDERLWRARLQKLLPSLLKLQKPDNQEKELRLIQSFIEQAPIERMAKGVLNSETINKLDIVHWNAQQLKTFIEAVLAEWKLLSAHEALWEEVDERNAAAPDGLFQVVIRPTKSSLAVSCNKRAVYVPHDFNRSLTSAYPAGCLPVVAHELTHVLQAIADDELGKEIPLATIKGQRYRTGREAGGVYQENLVHEHYFGRVRPRNLHYARAMAVKLMGGTQLAVIRAFYNSYALESPTLAGAPALAVDRALRLYRSGDYNTPEGVIEQADLLVQLHQLTPKQATLFALAGSSFSPADALLLRRSGLLKLSRHLACEPAHDVLRLFTSKFLPKIDIMSQETHE